MDAVAAAGLAYDGGVRFFQYRDKRSARRTIYETCLRLARFCAGRDSLFIVNDHADIAAAVDADGVHLGQDDLPIGPARRMLGPDRIIGISTHTREQARTAEAAGADYIGFGPIAETRTKDAGEIRGTEGLLAVRRSVSIPVIAIGGITGENLGEVLMAGADGIAVISAVLGAPDIAAASRNLVRAMAKQDRVL